MITMTYNDHLMVNVATQVLHWDLGDTSQDMSDDSEELPRPKGKAQRPRQGVPKIRTKMNDLGVPPILGHQQMVLWESRLNSLAQKVGF